MININFVKDNINTYNTRIRKGKASEVYYNGFKVFTSDGNTVDIIDNMFCMNSTCLNKVIKNEKIKDYLKELKSLRDYFFTSFKIKSIKFDLGEANNINWQQRNEIKQLGIDLEKKVYYFEETSIEKEFEILKVMFHDYKHGNSNVFKNLKITYDYIHKEMDIYDAIKKIPDLVKMYVTYTKYEKEKYYQHLFLLNLNNDKINEESYRTIFGDKDVIPFEEEYYIVDGKESDNNGRIDCVFYSKNGKSITDIYLIELKVDTGVIGGANGIHKHLLDIEHIDELNKSFFDNLIERINYRNECLDNEKYIPLDGKNYNAHFYIIIGKNKSSNDQIESKVKSLRDINSSTYNEVKKEIQKYSNEVDRIQEIYKVANKKMEIKLFIDDNIWNLDDNFNPNFIDKTDWIK